MVTQNKVRFDGVIESNAEALLYDTSTVLAGDADFTTSLLAGVSPGDWIPRGVIRELDIAGIADQVSDSDGVLIEESMDAVAVHNTPWKTTAAIDVAVTQVVELTMRYFRFRWQNATTIQGEFWARVTGRV